ncbi:hypothetical protein CH380_07900 [Leptospira adleri]|uniref:Tetratricopeptide repeat protein n=1 Tax=Leptospira adleri TaxID=2023186 RepID=A0A2M9YQV0_9LEPT|nr:tetratricopeptide repeat protein [Leptospira adleri]PJZ53918.1 hypothetical protein CH380_07900 [Leptospira adleri]PJZ62006.1 hypothetical protein CH376_10105 [Leptospira adleri]
MKQNTKRISFTILLLAFSEEPIYPEEVENRVVYFEESSEETKTQKTENSTGKETKIPSRVPLSAEQKDEKAFPSDENFAKQEILKIEEEWNRYSPEDPKKLAAKLSTLGAIKQKFRDYKTAILFYEQSLAIQDRLGENKSREYALTLYLKSIAEFRIGQTCRAVVSIQSVIEIYHFLGDVDSAIQAEDSFKKYSSFCPKN